MNATSAVRCTTSVPRNTAADDVGEHRQAIRAIAVSALGLALTGLLELMIALVSGSAALFGDAVHKLLQPPNRHTNNPTTTPRINLDNRPPSTLTMDCDPTQDQR
jgi:hypothetical protein